ncbi:MAG: zinc-ribbon domain-containing protein [Candidatus Hodarchaeota archaeon]
MAWVPFIVAGRRNRCCRNRSVGGMVAGLGIFLVFGLLMFVFFFRSDGITIIPLWPMISGLGGFIIFIMIIGVIASLMSAPPKNANEELIKPYQYQPQESTQQFNPYKMQNSIKKQSEEPIYRQAEEIIPITSDINYCRFCGAKVDRDANFCHQCGTKL